MKMHFDRHAAKLTPGEDARLWKAVADEREARKSGGGQGRRWMWPGLATGTAAAAVALFVMWGPDADPIRPGGPLAVTTDAVQEELAAAGEDRREPVAESAEKPAAEHLRVDGNLEGAGPDDAAKPRPDVPAQVAGDEAKGDPAATESDAPVEIQSTDPRTEAPGVVVPEERYPIQNKDIFDFRAEQYSPDAAHLRGGRTGEVQYKIDGVPVTDPLVGGKPEMSQLADNDPAEKNLETEGRRLLGPPPVAVAPPPVSVGGTDPVNDEPHDAMFFEDYGTNPFVAVEDDRYATFAMDVDNASYTMTRSYILGGNLPPRDAVRVEEFVNALEHHYPAPSGKLMASRTAVPSKFGTFAIYLDAAPSPYNAKNTLLRVGLKGREIAKEHRKPANLTFVIDVSGSMARDNRLGLVKRSLHLLLDELRPSDRLALVVYGSTAQVVLPPTHAEESYSIRRAIDALHTGGSTNAEQGLVEGYALAARMFSPGSINRVILCSDGVANVGNTGADSILERIRQEAGRGIELTAVGFGMGNYNDVLMEQLANKGDGNYYYVDTLREAERIFRDGLTGTLETIAKDAKIQVEFTEGVVKRYRLLGYENRGVADQDFRNDAVDAGEVGAGHEVTALFELRLEDDVDDRDTAAIVRIRYQNPATGEVIEEARELRASMIEDRFESTDPGFRMDAAAAQFAEILRGSYWAKELDLGRVAAMARSASRDLGRTEQTEELVGLIERAATLKR